MFIEILYQALRMGVRVDGRRGFSNASQLQAQYRRELALLAASDRQAASAAQAERGMAAKVRQVLGRA